MTNGVLRVATSAEVAQFRGGGYQVPDGYEPLLIDEFVYDGGVLKWRRPDSSDLRSKRCRWMAGRKQCGATPIVAVLRRGTRDYGYCSEHLYGRVYDGERLLALHIHQQGTP